MSKIAIILLATFAASDCARIRLDKAEELLDGKDAGGPEHGVTSAVGGSEAASVGQLISQLVEYPEGHMERDEAGYHEPDLARAFTALDAAVDEGEQGHALGDSAIEASIARLDAIKIKLANLLSDSPAKREKLYYAAERGDLEVVTDLVKHGVNVNSNFRSWRHGSDWAGTPLQHAARKGHPEIVRVLLEAGAEKDCSAMDSRSPLWYAAEGKEGDSLGVMRVLLEAKANTVSACMKGLLPLHMAASKGRVSSVQLLLDFGADADGSGASSDQLGSGGSSDQLGGKNRGSPLVDATGQDANPEVALILIKAGADPDLASSRGKSPLHNCAEWNYAGIARLLLEAHANKDATDDDGRTPLFVAAQAGSIEVARMLIEAGARSCLSNNNGEMPSTVAKNEEIRKMLEMIPKLVVAITWLDDEVVVTRVEPLVSNTAPKPSIIGRIRRISKSILGTSPGVEVMRLPKDSTLDSLRAEVAQKLGTDPPMVEVLLPSGDMAPHADHGGGATLLRALLLA